MVIKTAEIQEVVGVTTKKFPKFAGPEIAFAGRSNVGKSSLARTSSTPGKTQTINWYNINNGMLYFVDLPGYGYAKVSLDFKAKWGPMVERYLNSSDTLLAVFLLIDSRRTPNEYDIMMYEWIKAARLTPIVIVTKSDKLKKNELNRALGEIKNVLEPDGDLEMVAFSALKRTGREDVIKIIDKLMKNGGRDVKG